MISILVLIPLFFLNTEGATVSGICGSDGETWGTLSEGYIDLSLSSFNLIGSAMIETSDMSIIESYPGAKIMMEDGAVISVGKYSQIALGMYCDLQMASNSALRTKSILDDDRINIICNSSWTFGVGAVLRMEQQTVINVTGRFELRDGVHFQVHRHSLLNVGSSFVLDEDISLILSPHSSFTVSPNNPSISTILSSRNSVTSVYLDDQAEVVIKGSFTVGNGTQTQIYLYNNAALLITSGGSFETKASSFFIGPSSFWVISGSFFVDETGFLFSAFQSNLSIAGNLEGTSGASIHIGERTTLSVGTNGQLAFNGAITMESSSQMVIQGKLTMDQNTALTMGSFSGFRIGEGVSLIMNVGSTLNMGARSTIAIDGNALCFFSNQKNITNNIKVICTPGREKNCPDEIKCYSI